MPVIIEIISFFYSRLVSEVATNQTKKSLLEKIIMIVKKGQRLKRYQKLKWFVIYVTTRKFSPAGIDSVIENICSIFSTFSKPFPTSPRKNKTNKQTLMHSSRFNFTCYHHPRATPGTSPAIHARGWGSVWSGPVAGVEGGANKYLLSGFAKYVLFLARFTRLWTSRLRIFKGKRKNLSENGWRGSTYQN